MHGAFRFSWQEKRRWCHEWREDSIVIMWWQEVSTVVWNLMTVKRSPSSKQPTKFETRAPTRRRLTHFLDTQDMNQINLGSLV